jgi:uncharacterized protein (DUF2147 family)
MRHFMAAGLMSLLPMGAALAETPAGDWLVKDGTAHIRVVQCNGAYWGVIDWTKGPPGVDENNPDPEKRTRSILDVPILINMRPANNRWEGQVYNAENGEIYAAHIDLAGPGVLRIEGCGFFGMICGGEDWTRVPLAKGSPPDQAVCSRLAK